MATPLRNFRISDQTYQAALEAAQIRGENLTEHVIVPALLAYVVNQKNESATS